MKTKMIFSFVLIFVLVLTVPGRYHNVYAAPLEDCDLDGYDDATGVPVPWPGYDETKGDTPDGPGGSKTPATAPGSTDSTAAGNSSSETPGKASSEDTDKADSGKSRNTNDANSGKTDSTKSAKTNKENSGKANKADSEKANSTVQDKTGKAESGKTGSTTSGKTNSTAADNTGKVESDKTSDADSVKTNSTAQENTEKAEDRQTSTTSIETDNTGSTVSGEGSNQDGASQSENKQAEVNSDNDDTVNTDTPADEIETVINAKGSLEITEAAGSIIHAGSSVIVLGSGFAGDIDNLEIEIQSEPRQLGIVESSKNGSFEAKLNIPEDLKAGIHHIVVLYQGKEITRQQIEVGPKAADSFLQALSVGFTKDNKGLIPGLLILLVLFVSGTGVLGVNVLFHSRQLK
ncbi:hypothetical protein [Anaerocolumna xylanovorans]|uniref:Uncharacterized protein n=1 Tax=Anaerocolumna xylanovorans DSM 12503 TaxID=1121345 RepID=A0A1M7XZX0_9FIRM|nr:hypothetical protein [Anaerocolumna xylanovorans]SHO44743.1 hypothetical protein SAMN02745217_00708 [Anaerocolumna xylanovorans DSM 12503]